MRNVRKLCAVAIVGAIGALGLAAIGAGPAAGAPTGYSMLETGDDTCQLATVDLATGATTLLPGVSDCPNDITLSPEGVVYGIDERVIGGGDFVVLLRYDAQGNETLIGRITTFEALTGEGGDLGGGLAFDNQGVLHAFFVGSDPGCDATIAYCLYTVDPSNPEAATFAGPMTEDQFFALLAGNCSGGLVSTQNQQVNVGSTAFDGTATTQDTTPSTTAAEDSTTTTTTAPSETDELDEPAGNPALFVGVDKSNGAVTPIGPLTGAQVWGMAYGPDGVLYGILYDGNGTAMNYGTIDPTTGAVTVRGLISVEETTAIGLAMPMGCPQLSFAG